MYDRRDLYVRGVSRHDVPPAVQLGDRPEVAGQGGRGPQPPQRRAIQLVQVPEGESRQVHDHAAHEEDDVAPGPLLDGQIEVEHHHGEDEEAVDDLLEERLVDGQVDEDEGEAVAQQQRRQRGVSFAHRLANL